MSCSRKVDAPVDFSCCLFVCSVISGLLLGNNRSIEIEFLSPPRSKICKKKLVIKAGSLVNSAIFSVVFYLAVVIVMALMAINIYLHCEGRRWE